jgi:tetratricopeptide (TPR) repeat protein
LSPTSEHDCTKMIYSPANCEPTKLHVGKTIRIAKSYDDFAGRIGYVMQTLHWRPRAAATLFLTVSAALAADTTSAVSEVNSAVRAAYLNNLATIYSSEAKYAAAEETYRQALELWQQKPGNEASVALALNNLGVLLRRQAR